MSTYFALNLNGLKKQNSGCDSISLQQCVNVLEYNSFVYFAGYVLKRLYSVHKSCTVCKTAQETNISVDKSATLFTACKEYESANVAASEIRHLVVPVQLFIDFLQSCDTP